MKCPIQDGILDHQRIQTIFQVLIVDGQRPPASHIHNENRCFSLRQSQLQLAII